MYVLRTARTGLQRMMEERKLRRVAERTDECH